MSYDNEDPRECAAVTAELSELALGILGGHRRSEVLNHVESCGRCGAELEHLSFAADAVLQLAPESEPSLGFEQRFFERFEASVIERRPRRPRRISVHSAVAAFLVVLGFGLGHIATARTSTGNGLSKSADLTSARLTLRGQDFGKVFVSHGRHEWIFMSIESRARAWPGTVTCAVTLVGGRVETIGKFNLSARYSAWGAPLESPMAQVRAVQVIASDGAVLARATLPA